MNNDNGLPAEVQKFMDTHLHTEEEREMFLEEYALQSRAKAAAEFMIRNAEEPTEEEMARIEATIARRKAAGQN